MAKSQRRAVQRNFVFRPSNEHAWPPTPWPIRGKLRPAPHDESQRVVWIGFFMSLATMLVLFVIYAWQE